MTDIRQELAAAGQIRAQQIRDERERRENPRKTTAANAERFAAAMTARLEELREQSQL